MIIISVSDFIYSWIKDLVIIFIIITLVDLVMPKGSMHRYIRFVIGLLIIFAVINPFVNLGNIDFQLDKEVFRNIDNQFSINEEIIEGQESQIEMMYKDKIANELEGFIDENTEYRVSELDIEIDKTEDNFGAISYINLLIQNEDMEVNEDSIGIRVKPVVLEYKNENEVNNEFLDLKDLISNRYEIDMDLIHISMNKLED